MVGCNDTMNFSPVADWLWWQEFRTSAGQIHQHLRSQVWPRLCRFGLDHLAGSIVPAKRFDFRAALLGWN